MVVVEKNETFQISTEEDIVRVRQTARNWARDRGLGLVDQTKIVTAASELARNALVHGGGGEVRFEAVSDEGKRGLRLIFSDEGPGIPDLEKAMRDGYTTGSGLGLGLSGSKRLSNDFWIESAVGKGTKVAIIRWKS
jgi:serine/threonine-protein kinase RsbT